MKRVVTGALTRMPGEPEDAQLERILKVPRSIEIFIWFSATTGCCLYTLLAAYRFDKSYWSVLLTFIAVGQIVLLLGMVLRMRYEKMLRPYAIQIFHRRPDLMPRGNGPLWPRQRWFLPYAFAIFVSCALTTTATILGVEGWSSYVSLQQQVKHVTLEQVSGVIDDTLGALLRDSAIPMFFLLAYLVSLAALAAWRLAQQQALGAQEVQEAMEALASGTPRLPNWVSTDEIGDLSSATARAFEKLKTLSLSLGQSAESLRHSAEVLGASTTKHTEALTLQATALQETQVTAQEIKQTSALASQKAERVLEQTERAAELGRASESAVQKSLDSLQEIGGQVREMAERVKALDARTRQIANITTTVKELADQSNMLALNAAIEAVRSGEHGKGFGVVAREIRSLADQSIRATGSVREILQDISSAIQTTVAITEKGLERVESSLDQVRAFGGNIQQLSGIVSDNAASVRQITAAVSQQNTGIAQIFQAVHDLSRLMEQTSLQVHASDEAVHQVRQVASSVANTVASYGWTQLQPANGKAVTPSPAPPR